jgi:hypothetical protein
MICVFREHINQSKFQHFYGYTLLINYKLQLITYVKYTILQLQ